MRLVDDQLLSTGGAVDQASSEAPLAAHVKRMTYEPALDGLRGIALVCVLLYHGGLADRLPGLVDATEGAFMPLSTFFVLSGYLITSLLLLEREGTGRIRLGAFWSRRFRRLMPAALITIGAVLALAPWLASPQQLEKLPGEALSGMGYVINWHFIAAGTQYADFFTSPSPFKHMWSLALEEQFYLFLPLVAGGLLTVTRGSRKVFGAALVVMIAGSTSLMVLLSDGGYTERVYMGTDTRVAEMLVGCLLAVGLAGRTVVQRAAGRRALEGLGVVAFAGMLLSWTLFPISTGPFYSGGLTAYALLSAIVIWAAVQPGGPLRHFLAVWPLRHLGRISYGVYLFHWPVIWWLDAERAGLTGTALLTVQLAVTVALAQLSYTFVESPIREGRRLTRWRPFVVVPGVFAAIVVVALVLPAPELRGSSLVLSRRERDVVPTTTAPVAGEAPPPPPVRVLAIGDSVGLTVTDGLAGYALGTGRIVLRDANAQGCGFVDGGDVHYIGIEGPIADRCNHRVESWPVHLTEFRPDVVLLVYGMMDIAERRLPGTGEWLNIFDSEYEQALRAEMNEALDVLGSSGATIAWLTYPHIDPHRGPDTLLMGPGPYAEADPARVDRLNEIVRDVAAARPSVRLVELAAFTPTLPGGEFNDALRPDGVHFGVDGARIVADWLGPQLVAIGEERAGG